MGAHAPRTHIVIGDYDNMALQYDTIHTSTEHEEYPEFLTMRGISRKYPLCGTYGIRQKDVGIVYIDASVNILKQWFHHTNKLRTGNHSCRVLQHAWNTHTPEAFTLVILEICKHGVRTEDKRTSAERRREHMPVLMRMRDRHMTHYARQHRGRAHLYNSPYAVQCF